MRKILKSKHTTTEAESHQIACILHAILCCRSIGITYGNVCLKCGHTEDRHEFHEQKRNKEVLNQLKLNTIAQTHGNNMA